MWAVMGIWICCWPSAKMTDWFYQPEPAVQPLLLGHWPYVIKRFYSIATVNIWNIFCLNHVHVYATNLAQVYCSLPIATKQGCLCNLMFWFDHWVPARNVTYTCFLFTCYFKCRGTRKQQQAENWSALHQYFYFFKMFLICAIIILAVCRLSLCG